MDIEEDQQSLIRMDTYLPADLTELRTDTAHHLVCPLDTFPKQLHVGRETKQTFKAAIASFPADKDALMACVLAD